MNTDRELLEQAAKAAGLDATLVWSDLAQGMVQRDGKGQVWEPLTNATDVHELAALTKLDVFRLIVEAAAKQGKNKP